MTGASYAFISDQSISSCRKVLKDCRDDEDEEESGYRICGDSLLVPYHESIEKAVTAITALSIASGSKHPDEIRNTLYYLAIYKGKNPDYRYELRKESAVNYEVWYKDYLMNEDQEHMFYIWYLRQIPYAAKEVYKSLNAPLQWDEYLKQARERMEQDEQLRTAFGYDLMKDVQTLTDWK